MIDKLDSFVKKYIGKKVDYDNWAGGQCVDLYRQYVKEVLCLPQSPPVTGARNVWDTYLKKHYKRVKNTLSAIPEKGDIPIWSKWYGPFGHIAIFLEGDIKRFKAFSQNDPLGKSCIIKEYKYDHILGWLHPKVETIVSKINDQTKIPVGGDWGTMEVQAIRSTLNDQKRDIRDLQGAIKTLNDSLVENKKKLKTITTELGKAKKGIQILIEDRKELEKKTKEPIFKNHLAKLLYRIAKRL